MCLNAVTRLRETVYPTIIIFKYMKALSNSDKLKSSIAPKMTDLITFLEKKENILYIQEEKFMEYIVI